MKFILNTSGAKNLTCFHGLYAKPGNKSLVPLMTLFLNSSLGRESFFQVNRFYGDGLNKLEPRDVEDMPCPVLPKLNRAEADELTRKLAELEALPLNDRTAQIDELATCYFDFANGVNSQPEEPSSSRQHQVRSPRLSGRHTHRAVQSSVTRCSAANVGRPVAFPTCKPRVIGIMMVAFS